MADGSLRITLEFDPRYAKEAYALFGARGTACAVAALTQEASQESARKETIEQPKEKPGQLCIMACTFCADPLFREWLGVDSEEAAKSAILNECRIKSRKELDTNHKAGRIFLSDFRNSFLAWRDARRDS